MGRLYTLSDFIHLLSFCVNIASTSWHK